MKKRALSLLLCVMLIVGMLPATAMAAGATDTWDVKLNVSESDAYTYNGQKVLALGFGVQSDNLTIRKAASIVLAFDLEILDFIQYDSDGNAERYEPSAGNLVLNSNAVAEGKEIKKKPAQSWAIEAHCAKSSDGKLGYMQMLASQNYVDYSIVDATDIATAYLGFKTGKSVKDLTSDSIRFAKPAELGPLNQSASITITDGDKNTQHAILEDGTADTLKVTPEIMWKGITPSEPAKTTPTCVAPTGVTAEFGSALSTITLTNPATNTPGTWFWMNNTQKVGNVKDNPHTYKAKFVPADTTYATVEDIDVAVNATKVALGSGSPIMIHIEETYTGSAIEPKPSIRVSDMYSDELVLDQDYEITKYENNKNVGEGRIHIAPLTTGNYDFTAGSYPFTIKRATGSISIADPGTIAYDGSVVEVGSGKDLTYTYKGDGSVTVKWYADNSGTKGSELTGGAPKDAGTYWIGVSAADGTNYFGVSEVTKKFTISPAEYSFTKPATDTATINQPRPTSAPATATGVGSESVSGMLSWHTDSTCNTAASGKFTTAGSEEMYWKFTPDTAETNYVTTPITGKVTFNISTLPAQTVSFTTVGPITKNFGDPAFTNAASTTTGGGTITYSGDKDAVATVNSTTGEVTIHGVGTVTITATAAATTGYAETKVSYTLNVSPKTITPVVTLSQDTYEYDGTDKNPGVTVEITAGGVKLDAADYTVEYADNWNAGTAKVTVKPVAGRNYTWTPDAEKNFTITQAPTPAAPNGLTGMKGKTLFTVNLPTGWAWVNGADTMDTLGDQSFSANYHDENSNYADGTASVTVTVVDKTDANVTITGAPTNKTYGDADFTLTASAADVGTGTGTWTWTSSDSSVLEVTGSDATATVKILKAGAATISAKFESDTTVDTETTAAITVGKATITVAAKNQSIYVGGTVPSLTSPVKDTHYTVTGLVGSDTLGGTITMEYQKSGTTAIPDVTKAGTYDIVISGATEPAGGNYNTIVFQTATLTISNPSHSGGGGGSYTPSYSITVDKTENGTITVSPKSASKGDTVTITVKPDKGYELEMLKALDKDGDALKLTEKNGKYTFKMPTGKVTVKGSFVEEAPEQIFKDVPVDAYYYEAVKWAAEKGVTGGVGNGLFAPNQPCTRAQIVTFLWRAAGSPAPKNMSSFTDVPADAFYAMAVAWAVENGITGGTGDGKFSPDATCTRAQAVTFLYRAAGSPKVSGSAEFGDVATNAYYADAVAWAAKNGITGGIGGGLFGSDNDCTRAQIVTFLYRSVK